MAKTALALETGTIVAKNGIEFLLALEKRGIDPKSVYFKCKSLLYFQYDLDIPMLFGKGNEVEEYRQLCALYNADPAHVVAPIAEVKQHADGSVIGYVMEGVTGYSLGALDYTYYHSQNNRTESEVREKGMLYLSSMEELVRVVRGLHDKGVGHGDLPMRNVIVTRSGIKLVDPYPRESEEETIREDLIVIAGYERNIAKLRVLLRS